MLFVRVLLSRRDRIGRLNGRLFRRLNGRLVGRIAVLEGRAGRRSWSESERARIAAESLAPGVRVADVARRHKVTRWQVYDWRKKLKAGVLALPAETAKEPMFAALVVEPKPTRPSRRPKKRGVTAKPGKIELVVDGVTLRVSRPTSMKHN